MSRQLLAVIAAPIALDELSELSAKYPDSQLSPGQGGYWVTSRGEWCPCITCEGELAETFGRLTGDLYFSGFIVCPNCGNKRCPKATLHSNECSGSNEPGQTGSVYA